MPITILEDHTTPFNVPVYTNYSYYDDFDELVTVMATQG